MYSNSKRARHVHSEYILYILCSSQNMKAMYFRNVQTNYSITVVCNVWRLFHHSLFQNRFSIAQQEKE